MGTRGSFPGVKRPGCKADPSLPSSAKFKNAWSYTFTLPIHLHGVVLITGHCLIVYNKVKIVFLRENELQVFEKSVLRKILNVKVKVKLSLGCTKYHTMKAYPLLN
jgi:hypothetical protein